MLRFVLSGIAIAAAGYAVKEYCDKEECWDEWLDLSEMREQATVKNRTQSRKETVKEKPWSNFEEMLKEETSTVQDVEKQRKKLALIRRMLLECIEEFNMTSYSTQNQISACEEDIKVTEEFEYDYHSYTKLLKDACDMGSAYLHRYVRMMEIVVHSTIDDLIDSKEALALIKIFEDILDIDDYKEDIIKDMDFLWETIDDFISFKKEFVLKGEKLW